MLKCNMPLGMGVAGLVKTWALEKVEASVKEMGCWLGLGLLMDSRSVMDRATTKVMQTGFVNWMGMGLAILMGQV